MLERSLPRRPALFGVALDPTDDELKLSFKAILARDLAAGRSAFRNPFDALRAFLGDLIAADVCETAGEIDIPSWLTPSPTLSELSLVSAENHLRFIDEGGCLEVAGRVAAFVRDDLAGGMPAMIAVDHSATGGVLRALAGQEGSSDTTVLVVDSHFDGLQLSERMDLARYASEERRDGADEDPVALEACGAELRTVPDSYNCATWLRYLVEERVVPPHRLIVFGVSDYPSEELRHDSGLRRYVDAYRRFEEAGVTFVTKEEIRRKGVRSALAPLLDGTVTDRLYLSLDADIGSLDAVHAARFMNVKGLSAEALTELACVLGETLEKKRLVGLDVCGIETFLLGRTFPDGVKDRTVERLSDFVRILLGHEPRYSCRHPLERRDPSALCAKGSPLSRA